MLHFIVNILTVLLSLIREAENAVEASFKLRDIVVMKPMSRSELFSPNIMNKYN